MTTHWHGTEDIIKVWIMDDNFILIKSSDRKIYLDDNKRIQLFPHGMIVHGSWGNYLLH